MYTAMGQACPFMCQALQGGLVSLSAADSCDSSYADPAVLAMLSLGQFCRCGFVGEGNDVQFAVSPELIHPQITIYGVWVTSTGEPEKQY